jgi:hypothetical protein
MWWSRSRASLSKTISWPRRGVTVKSWWPEVAVEGVGVQSGRVDEVAGAEGASGGGEEVRAVSPTDFAHRRVEVQVDSVPDRLRRVRQCRRPGADDALAGHVQGAERTRAEMRFTFVEFGTVDQAGVTVLIPYGLLRQVR